VCAPDAATPPPPPQTPAPPPAPTPVQRCITFLSQPTRKRKRYEELGNAQQYERKLLARTCLEVLDVKAAQLAERSISPGAIMLVPHATRARMRQVRGCRLPCETLIIRRRVSMATTHGTHTSTFDRGAYLTDPLTFVDKISGSSPLLVVGGDAGGGHTKLGITFINSSGNQTFAALLVYEGAITTLNLLVCEPLASLHSLDNQKSTLTSLLCCNTSLIQDKPSSTVTGLSSTLC
jgi:hypothetical protein